MTYHRVDSYTWHQAAWQLVDAYFSQQESGLSKPTALLCSGIQGLGKKSFVDLLVKKLFCARNTAVSTSNSQAPNQLDSSEPKESALRMPCEACQGCRLLNAGNHSDYLEVRLVENAIQIKIEQVREAVAKVNLSPQIAPLKIVVIHPVEKLNENASNALLKSLEEPPGDTLYVLISHQLNSVKATIRSRCRMVNFTSPEVAQIKRWLEAEEVDAFESKDIELLASLYGNSPNLIKQALEEGTVEKLKSWSNQLRNFHLQSPVGLIKLFKEWSPEGVGNLLRWTQFWLMGVIKNKLKSAHKPNPQDTDLTRLFALLELVTEKQKLLADSPQLNEQLLFLDFAHQWQS